MQNLDQTNVFMLIIVVTIHIKLCRLHQL